MRPWVETSKALPSPTAWGSLVWVKVLPVVAGGGLLQEPPSSALSGCLQLLHRARRSRPGCVPIKIKHMSWVCASADLPALTTITTTPVTATESVHPRQRYRGISLIFCISGMVPITDKVTSPDSYRGCNCQGDCALKSAVVWLGSLDEEIALSHETVQ